MAKIRPFRAIRPVRERAAQVAAFPYDVMSSQEARELVKDNPYSFLRIDKAEVDLEPEVDLYDTRVYEQAAHNLKEFRREGILIQDEEPYLYIYRLTMGNHSQTGLVFCASVDDYLNNVIKKHEYTRADKEEDRIKHVDYCNANTGPILMTHRSEPVVKECLKEWTATREPVYDFTAGDGIGHQVWLIDDGSTIGRLVEAFGGIESLYIADGHHRSASAVKVALKRREADPGYTGDEEYNYFLAVAFPGEELRIMDYNRVVKDLNGLTAEEFLNRLGEKFLVEKADRQPFAPDGPRIFGMYLEGQWYRLTAREGTYDKNDPVAALDVSILQHNLLEPVLGIRDPRRDDRIDFVGGIRGLGELEKLVNQGMAVAFALYPTTVEELMAISDRGQVMPPKSTWFEPKLRSGLFIHELT
ncbi:MAG: DUF1015 domain-containing protein [Clostridia bacterium]|nr:DUF1015 domain-containing protein [Clostridia bacterium]